MPISYPVLLLGVWRRARTARGIDNIENEESKEESDYKDVVGQENAKRAMMIAA